MPDWSRRQTLSTLVGGFAVVLAGCQGDTRHESPSDDERRVENYELERVRNEDEAPLFGRTDELQSVHHEEYDYLATEERFRELTFAGVPAARTLRSFTAATDFESRSVYLSSRRVAACDDVQLQRVELDRTGPIARFCQKLRPAETDCEADAYHTVGFAIRLPFPGDEYHHVGSGTRSTCSQSSPPEAFDGNVTLATERGGR